MILQRPAPFIFFRSLLQNPRTIGAVAPSSPGLSKLMVSSVDPKDTSVLEIGAGTGAVTRALLKRGVDRENLFVIERDASLVRYLKEQFPGVRVRCGDAADTGKILAAEAIGQVKTVISSLPLRNLPSDQRSKMVGAILDALCPTGQLIQYTYALGCPFPSKSHGVRAECLGRVWMNLPPAAVWRFTR